MLVNEYPQSHPSKASEVRAVVLARRKTPVRIVETERVPFLPMYGISTNRPPMMEPGTPMTLIMTWLRYYDSLVSLVHHAWNLVLTVMYVEPSPKSAPRLWRLIKGQ